MLTQSSARQGKPSGLGSKSFTTTYAVALVKGEVLTEFKIEAHGLPLPAVVAHKPGPASPRSHWPPAPVTWAGPAERPQVVERQRSRSLGPARNGNRGPLLSKNGFS